MSAAMSLGHFIYDNFNPADPTDRSLTHEQLVLLSAYSLKVGRE